MGTRLDGADAQKEVAVGIGMLVAMHGTPEAPVALEAAAVR